MAVCLTVAEVRHGCCKFKFALEAAVERLVPKYEKIGVKICQKEVSTGGYGDSSKDYYYRYFEVANRRRGASGGDERRRCPQ